MQMPVYVHMALGASILLVIVAVAFLTAVFMEEPASRRGTAEGETRRGHWNQDVSRR
jgi:hypothetical protein